ncbi:response regulator transcription factor [Chloroflexota bacterium]
MKVLLIEDSTEIVDIVAATLKLRWPEVEFISGLLGKEGLDLVKKELPDIVVLDLGLPDLDGFQVLRSIREFTDLPVVILTVRGEETDKIQGLELGADDYMTKPFSPGEFLARLRALLRRSQITKTTASDDGKLPSPSTRGKLRIDFTSQEVSVDDKFLKLSPREYDLLYLLATNEGKVVPNQTLLERVFPENKDNIKFLEVYIKKLREKLEMNPDSPETIINEGRTGYKLVGL